MGKAYRVMWAITSSECLWGKWRRTAWNAIVIVVLVLTALASLSTPKSMPFNKMNAVDHIMLVRRHFLGHFRYNLSSGDSRKEKIWISNRNSVMNNKMSCDHLSEALRLYPLIEKSDFKFSSPISVGNNQTIQLLTKLTESMLGAENKVKHMLKSSGFKVMPGGWFYPTQCSPRETVAIIVPYRNRTSNLLTFLNYMHRFLQRQNRQYVIVVAEQRNSVPFNRAKLLNAIINEIGQDYPYVECFILQDVDKLPYHGLNLYGCEYHPKQMASMKWYYEAGVMDEYYPYFFGGATAFTRWQLLRMNGGSNVFYGWGGEDDDLLARTLLAGFQPIFQSKYIGRMLVQSHHDDTKMLTSRYEMLYMRKVLHRMINDGLYEVLYNLTDRIERPLYTLYSFQI